MTQWVKLPSIQALVQVLIATLLIQLSANALGEAEDGLCFGASATHVGDLEDAPITWLQPGLA